MRSDGNFDVLCPQLRFQRRGNGDEPRPAARIEQSETTWCDFAGEHVWGNSLQRGPVGPARQKAAFARSDLEKADVAGWSRTQPVFAGACECVRRRGRQHLKWRGRHREGQIQAHRATGHGKSETREREAGSPAIGKADNQRQQAPLLGEEQQCRIERCMVHRVHDVADRTADEGLGRLPKPRLSDASAAQVILPPGSTSTTRSAAANAKATKRSLLSARRQKPSAGCCGMCGVGVVR